MYDAALIDGLPEPVGQNIAQLDRRGDDGCRSTQISDVDAERRRLARGQQSEENRVNRRLHIQLKGPP
jgi:hypothetical protein